MKMKRLLAWLLALVMCFMLAACQNTTKKKSTQTQKKTQTTESTADTTGSAQTDSTKAHFPDIEIPDFNFGGTDEPQKQGATPLLYRVTDTNGNVIWLFGSIHIGREDYYPLPDYVMNAFHNADSLAVEADMVAFLKNTNAQKKALHYLSYHDGTTIKDHIPQDLYDEAVRILKENNAYVSVLDDYCPFYWSSMIEALTMPDMEANSNLGIDMHLLNSAYSTGKEILEVESAEFQYKMFAGFDDEVQFMLLASAVQSYAYPAEAKAQLEDMMDLWASGDEAAFSAYLNAPLPPETPADEKAAYERYNKAMLTDRNINMADYAESALASGKEVFICVGAAHVVGNGALVDLLTQRGYTVERVTK